MPKTSGLESIAKRKSAWDVEFDSLRVKLADGSVVRPDSLNLEEVFAGKVELWNGRITYDLEQMSELRDSIAAIGVKNDLRGYYSSENGEQVIIVTDGHRRLFATTWARQQGNMIARVPLKADNLEKGQTDAHYLLTQLTANSGQVPLTMLEQGLVVKRFLAYGNTIEEVVLQTGIKKQHLENCLALANTPGGVKELIRSGTVAPSTVVDSINNDKGEYRDVLDEALEIAEKEAEAKGKDKVKVTSTHVKQVREKRKAADMTVAQQNELLEAVKNTDWDALPPSVLLKVQELVTKHWAKK
jgi:hypothetical protein